MIATWKRRLAIEFLLFVIPPVALVSALLLYQLYFDLYISDERKRLDNRILELRQTMQSKIDSLKEADFIEAEKSSELKSLFLHKEYRPYQLTNIHGDTIPTHYLFYRKQQVTDKINALEAGIIGKEQMSGKYIPKADVYEYVRDKDPITYIWQPNILETGLNIYIILLIIIYPIRLLIAGTVWSVKIIKSKHVSESK